MGDMDMDSAPYFLLSYLVSVFLFDAYSISIIHNINILQIFN